MLTKKETSTALVSLFFFTGNVFMDDICHKDRIPF